MSRIKKLQDSIPMRNSAVAKLDKMFKVNKDGFPYRPDTGYVGEAPSRTADSVVGKKKKRKSKSKKQKQRQKAKSKSKSKRKNQKAKAKRKSKKKKQKAKAKIKKNKEQTQRGKAQ